MYIEALVVVAILIATVYVIYPAYFEAYVLMKIPEYRDLKNKLALSSVTLDSTISVSKASANATKALQVMVAQHKEKLLNCSLEIAQAKLNLTAALGDNTQLRDIQTKATATMKELNDRVIAMAPVDDVELARRIQKLRDVLMAASSSMREIACSNKLMMIDEVRQMAFNMRKPPSDRLDTGACNYNDRVPFGAKRNWSWWRKSLMFRTITFDDKTGLYSGTDPRYTGSIGEGLDLLLGEIESVISYAVKNRFCTKDLQFKVDDFEKYAIALINSLCGDAAWARDYNIPVENTMRRAASFLPQQ